VEGRWFPFVGPRQSYASLAFCAVIIMIVDLIPRLQWIQEKQFFGTHLPSSSYEIYIINKLGHHRGQHAYAKCRVSYNGILLFRFQGSQKRDVRGLLSLNYVITPTLAGMSFPKCIRNVVMDRHSPARPRSQIVCKICSGSLEKTRFILLSMHWMNAPMLREHHPPAKGPHVFERASWEHKFESTYMDHESTGARHTIFP
jgi:hypothetical protein